MTDDTERRLEERTDCAIAAKIELSDRLAIEVTLRDLSISGVRLQVAEAIDLPDEFNLLIPVMDTVEMRHRVKVAWRNADELGGEFLKLVGPATDAVEAIEGDRSKRKR